MTAFTLGLVAPRLAKARDDWHRHEAYRRQIERQRTDALLNAQRLLAHRELQLVRSWHTNDGKYIARRERKLAASVRTVRRLETP